MKKFILSFILIFISASACFALSDDVYIRLCEKTEQIERDVKYIKEAVNSRNNTDILQHILMFIPVFMLAFIPYAIIISDYLKNRDFRKKEIERVIDRMIKEGKIN